MPRGSARSLRTSSGSTGLAHSRWAPAEPRRQSGLVWHAAQPCLGGECRYPGHALGFIRRYSPGATPETMPCLDKLVDHAIAYYRDFVRPRNRYRHPTPRARRAGRLERLEGHGHGADAEAIVDHVYEVGKRHSFPELAPGWLPVPGAAGSQEGRASAASSPCIASTRRLR